MAKYTAPKGRLVRRFGANIFENPKYDQLLTRRPNPPGEHGLKQQRRRLSDYALQLQEKQKLRYSYGLQEKQFRRTFQRAVKLHGVTGDNLLLLLETRLDNAVFRAGFCASRMQARQLINHGHLRVNGRRVDIPSYLVKPGDTISVRQTDRSRSLVARMIDKTPGYHRAGWIVADLEQQRFNIQQLPARDALPQDINEQLIIELYSR